MYDRLFTTNCMVQTWYLAFEVWLIGVLCHVFTCCRHLKLATSWGYSTPLFCSCLSLCNLKITYFCGKGYKCVRRCWLFRGLKWVKVSEIKGLSLRATCLSCFYLWMNILKILFRFIALYLHQRSGNFKSVIQLSKNVEWPITTQCSIYRPQS